ncbi:hypothetical protein FGG08_004904 [Glutinoglossum americanum]|uniref:NYN domain-containing protein n=1 Tax=Glutinoglossum americanum TaxID=1670608 RepID=A0A9P8L2A2_9PEZI|nr:hypothetical protein FGG08_004904 [Glutinoglossum americanum]
MSSESAAKDWDFEPVIGLLHSLSSGSLSSATTSISKQYVSPIVSADEWGEGSPRLGNFDRLWEFLGQPKDIPPPKVGLRIGGKDSLHPASIAPTLKGVKWKDEVEGTELEDDVLGDVATDLSLTNMRRKKSSRASRKTMNQKAVPQEDSNGPVRSITAGLTGSSSELHALRENTQAESALLELYHDGFDQVTSFDFYDLSTGSSSTSPAIFSPLRAGTSWISSPQAMQIMDLSPAEKKARLISKLCRTFKADRGFLVSLASPSIGITSTGIHVFVDFSNILIGFCDCVKKSRGLSVSSHIRRPPLSFHSLSLILERGRPTAKRVLVGSKPLLPEFKEAEQCGYETNILDKVLKVPTPRKMRQGRSGYGTSGQSSGSETNARLPERKMEQAVDEILHLKIMESLLDWSKPATIVLATGDAAEAEYSGGFMKMVERALERGWQIELVSFRDNISNAYKNKAFRDKWREQFEIIGLDDFREELWISQSQ